MAAFTYNICSKCGKYYTSYIGAMGHAAGACDQIEDRKEDVLARLEEEARVAQERLDRARG